MPGESIAARAARNDVTITKGARRRNLSRGPATPEATARRPEPPPAGRSKPPSNPGGSLDQRKSLPWEADLGPLR